MNDQGIPIVDLDNPLKHWRQGDFALDVGGFLFANPAKSGRKFVAGEITENVVGLVIISQSCDIVRRTGGRDFLAVCPLVKIPEEQLSAIRKGRRPYFTDIENADENVFADLRRVMSVHKDVVQTWERQAGFKSEDGHRRFAAALERKFGQFAFPDEFDEAIKKFRERVWERHNKPYSEPGMVYRSLAEIRFRADPHWASDERAITVIAIMHERDNCEVARNVISEELDAVLDNINWPEGYKWGVPKSYLGPAKDLTAKDIMTSRRGDFDFLCY